VFQGSWSAGGLSSAATLTGIATNGTDIWLVDSYADKVYKYTGAASRLSGSQNAASSFSLVSGKKGNTNPQDIVTDGSSFWVVDGTNLKVFKYSLSGSSLGSWAIDSANTNPTGITINPSNVSDIWMVDNVTLKVYQYVAAASRTSGSQSAAATFALNPNDTNPQGFADPPVAGTEPVSVPKIPTPIAAPLLQSLPRLSLSSDWVRLIAPTMPASSAAGSNAGPTATQARTAVPAEAAQTLEPTGIPQWGSASEQEAVDQVFADPAFELVDDELTPVSTDV
jgi:hypothetical protein